jgi:signal transduction histidine kinase
LHLYSERYQKIASHLYSFLTIVALNSFWLLNGGSNGPTLFNFAAQIALIAHFSSKKPPIILSFIIAANIIILFYIEWKGIFPINQYSSMHQRYLDHLFVLVYFFILVLPLMFFVRTLMLKKLEKAQLENYNKTSYLANMSHEIRTPMNAIIGFSDLMMDPGINEKERQSYLSVINENSVLLLKLINNILDLSKLDSNLVIVRKTNFKLANLLQQVYYSHIHQINTAGIHLEIDLPEKLRNVVLLSDQVLLFQVYSNLINNALKVTREGEIRFGVRLKDEMLSFFVFDTGPGIPPDQQKWIFERFNQLNNKSTNRNYSGFGLGLSICKQIINLLEGKLELHSQLNAGSTFTFTLPASIISTKTPVSK